MMAISGVDSVLDMEKKWIEKCKEEKGTKRLLGTAVIL